MSAPADMSRPLGVFESTQLLASERFPFNVVIALRLQGAPPPERIAQALHELAARHPLLRMHVETGNGVSRFVAKDTPAIPLALQSGAGRDGWIALVETELERPFDLAKGPLLRVGGLQTGPTLDLVLTGHHLILDAASAANLVRELLSLCGGASGGLPALTLQPAADWLLPPRAAGWRGALARGGFMARQLADEIGFRFRSRGHRKQPLHASGHCRVLPLALSETATTALIDSSRRRHLTLNSVLNAAMLLIVKRRVYAGAERPLRYFSFANLRPYLRPPLGPIDLGGYFAMMRFTAQVADRDDLWGLADRINRQVYQAARRGEKFTNLQLSLATMRMLLRLGSIRMAHTALSYTGVAEVPRRYGDLELLELHAFVSNFVLGPEYTAQARLLGGRLWLDILYLDCDMDAERARDIGNRMLELLETAGTTN